MVTLPGMRPNLFPNAEYPKPPFGIVSPVSTVNRPSVPVVATIGVNFGAGLYSSLAAFFSPAAFCAGRAGSLVDASSTAPVAPAALASAVEADESALPAFLASLAFLAGLFASAGHTSAKVRIRNARQRVISRHTGPTSTFAMKRTDNNQVETPRGSTSSDCVPPVSRWFDFGPVADQHSSGLPFETQAKQVQPAPVRVTNARIIYCQLMSQQDFYFYSLGR